MVTQKSLVRQKERIIKLKGVIKTKASHNLVRRPSAQLEYLCAQPLSKPNHGALHDKSTIEFITRRVPDGMENKGILSSAFFPDIHTSTHLRCGTYKTDVRGVASLWRRFGIAWAFAFTLFLCIFFASASHCRYTSVLCVQRDKCIDGGEPLHTMYHIFTKDILVRSRNDL